VSIFLDLGFCQPSLEGHEYLVVEEEIMEAVFMCGGLKKLCRYCVVLILGYLNQSDYVAKVVTSQFKTFKCNVHLKILKDI
jgi:hypothetical protein